MKKLNVYLLFLLCFVLLSACSEKPKYEKTITPFSYVDENGQTFGTEQLTGEIWIADFIFTKCTTVCQPMTAEMAGLQKLFKNKNFDVHFVSFTVDPEIDQPAVLKQFASDFTEDLSNWHFLTGYSQEEVELFAREQFKTIVQKPTASSQVIHGTNFYLVDQRGVLSGEYNFVDASYVNDIVKDIKKLHK